MAETCGGVGFFSNNFTSRKTQKDPLNNYLQKRRDFNQQTKIHNLEAKAVNEGLTTKEKVDLVATKIDSALNNKGDSTMMYYA